MSSVQLQHPTTRARRPAATITDLDALQAQGYELIDLAAEERAQAAAHVRLEAGRLEQHALELARRVRPAPAPPTPRRTAATGSRPRRRRKAA